MFRSKQIITQKINLLQWKSRQNTQDGNIDGHVERSAIKFVVLGDIIDIIPSNSNDILFVIAEWLRCLVCNLEVGGSTPHL